MSTEAETITVADKDDSDMSDQAEESKDEDRNQAQKPRGPPPELDENEPTNTRSAADSTTDAAEDEPPDLKPEVDLKPESLQEPELSASSPISILSGNADTDQVDQVEEQKQQQKQQQTQTFEIDDEDDDDDDDDNNDDNINNNENKNNKDDGDDDDGDNDDNDDDKNNDNADNNNNSNNEPTEKATREFPTAGVRGRPSRINGRLRNNRSKKNKKYDSIPRRRGTRQLTRVREMDRELATWINGFYTNDKLDELTRDMITQRAGEIAREKKILDFAGTGTWFTRFLGRNFSDASVSKQLKMLSFVNPGKFLDDFDPERSAREMRKMNRRIYRENVKKNQMYDDSGRLLDNSKDVCDCLDEDCPGCHFPCRKCGSEKCGTECRCNRRWVYEMVEVEGTNLVINNPSLV